MRLIDADALIEEMVKIPGHRWSTKTFGEALDRVPTVDPNKVSGGKVKKMTIDHENVIHALNTHAQYGTCVLSGKVCGYFGEEKCTALLVKDAEALIIGMMEQILEAQSCLHCAKNSRCDPNADPDTQEYDTFYQCRHGSVHKENWVWKGVECDEMR